jgi:hypothetical protein
MISSESRAVSIDASSATDGNGKLLVSAGLAAAGEATMPEWRISGLFEDTPIETLFLMVGLEPPLLANSTDGRFALSGPSDSLGAWLSGLAGEIQLDGGMGEAQPNLRRILPKIVGPIDCLAGSASIRRGLAVSDGVFLQSDGTLVALQGSYDLRGRILDARALTYAEPDDQALPAEGVELVGPLDAIEVNPLGVVAIDPRSKLGAMVHEFAAGGELNSDHCRLTPGAK